MVSFQGSASPTEDRPALPPVQNIIMTDAHGMSWPMWTFRSVVFIAIAVGQVVAAQPHVGEYALADVQRGSQLFRTQCTSCHGAAGDQVPGVSLLTGRFRRVSSDDDLAALIRDGISEMGMPPGNYSAEELTAFVAYLRSVAGDPAAIADTPALSAGNPQQGSELFHGKAECTTCHRVRGVGGFQGPNLSNIGAVRSAPSLLQSLLSPSAEIIPLNREIRAVTRRGGTVVGRRMNEDTYSIQLMDAEGRLTSLMKANLRDMTVLESSSMPSYENQVTADELADIVAYLRSLKTVD